ncbi:H-type small acid-soluble spore protein [Oceanirhabdus sp. W0125-5]|uniref:H-type small acid-soluble spore protein n=1 Tax=Oceanirhabdus sp. W0125-5 TaxID=2999116 RepID=UPI0022F30047|nr:H-type small acid-soluble spore protein [Oceanirhabdus sp. W0125-5]WBW97842.1 H-type small acid-soluble spore protein [Oceanirhabdus sp. W0125-5]
MLMRRAQEIFNSKGVFDVKYNNTNVWINELNFDKNTAIIKDLNNNQVMEVEVSNLIES